MGESQPLEEYALDCGLHLDVNGGFHHRACTVILYLNSCESGCTVFPCAGDKRSRKLGSKLAAGGVSHTNSTAVKDAGLGEHATELLERAALPGALRVAPRTGCAALFFSLLGQSGLETEEARNPKV